jgi:hypothetical protein
MRRCQFCQIKGNRISFAKAESRKAEKQDKVAKKG